MSGDVARYGEWATNGINLAVEEINNHGVDGRKIEVVFEDSKGKPAEAVSAYQKLRNVDQVHYVITYQSSIALAVAPLANQDQVIQMDVSATTPAYSSPGDYTFRTSIIATKLAEQAAELLLGNLNAPRIGLLTINNDFGKGMAKAFRDSYQGTIVVEEVFQENETDFRAVLGKFKNKNISHIFLVGHLKSAGLIVKQAKELGINIPFLSEVHSVEGPDFLSNAQDAAEGIIYVAPKFDPNEKISNVASFVTQYRERYNTEPTYFAAQAYDGVMALAHAWEKCEPEDTNCVKNVLPSIDFEGASGRIKFDRNGDVDKPVELKTVRGRQFMRL